MNVLWLTAAVSVVTGIALTASDLRQRESTFVRLDRKLAALNQLEDMEASAARRRQMVTVYGKAPAHPSRLEDLVKSELAGPAAEVREQPPTALLPGWTLRRAEVLFSEIQLSAMADFAARVEKQRPPWRVVEVSIRASPKAGNYAQVQLILESLERTK